MWPVDGIDSSDDDLPSDDEDADVVTKEIAKLLVGFKNKTESTWGKQKLANSNVSKVPRCYKCGSK